MVTPVLDIKDIFINQKYVKTIIIFSLCLHQKLHLNMIVNYLFIIPCIVTLVTV
ncbi:Hypothetical protein EIN_433880, partial [Entamoeba invadens IP1]